ncbi:MAG: GNAT family N-acetyltransferase [Bacillota bacterium]|nr:GNAT family N-acetyltransferase [Bacillota bacterium]
MRRYCPLFERDIPLTEKLLRRIQSFEGDFPLPDLKKASGDGRAYVAKENGRIISLCLVSHNLGEALFPKSHSEAKLAGLLEKSGCRDEALLAIYIYVDPAYWGKGAGNDLLQYMYSLYPHRSYLAPIGEDKKKAMDFFHRHGFYLICEIPDSLQELGKQSFLFLKRHKKEGLACMDF